MSFISYIVLNIFGRERGDKSTRKLKFPKSQTLFIFIVLLTGKHTGCIV